MLINPKFGPSTLCFDPSQVPFFVKRLIGRPFYSIYPTRSLKFDCDSKNNYSIGVVSDWAEMLSTKRNSESRGVCVMCLTPS